MVGTSPDLGSPSSLTAQLGGRPLRPTSPTPALLRGACYRRGKLYIRLGKKAQARTDLGAVIADDPTYLGAREVLESITQ